MKPKHERAREIGERLREMDERAKDKRLAPEGPYFVSFDDAEDAPDHAHSGLAKVDTGRSGDWPIARLCYWPTARLIASIPEMQLALQGLADALRALLKDGLSADEARLCMVACNAPAMSSPYNTDGISLNQRCDQIAQDERTAYTALDAAKPFLPKEKETNGT